MAVTKATCTIQTCGRQYLTRIDSPYCPLCRRNIMGWAKRPAAHIIQYQDTLRLRSHRLSMVVADTRKGNVVAFRRDMGRRRHG